MSKQFRARALYKYGKLYPHVFPDAIDQASELYRSDRIDRGVEEPSIERRAKSCSGFIATHTHLAGETQETVVNDLTG